MAKGAYIGVNNVARKIKKGYIGVNGLARRIKKAYIGVGGVARPCWSSGELEYYGPITPLSKKRYGLAATSVGDIAIFGGGYTGEVGTQHKNGDVYDKSLNKVQVDTSNFPSSYYLAATTVGDYAFFGGGTNHYSTNEYTVSRVFHIYDSLATLVKTFNSSLIGTNLAATTVGDYAFFGGGKSITTPSSSTTAYNSSGAHYASHSLSVARSHLAATTVGDYALFAGGLQDDGTRSGVVDVFSSSLTRYNTLALTRGVYCQAATTLGNYALFAGGEDGTNKSRYVYCYSSSLTMLVGYLTKARYNLAATTVGEYAVFAGGFGTNGYSDTADGLYGEYLTQASFKSLSVARYELAATTVGNYALFGGGQNSAYSDAVDVYTVY